MKQTLQWMRNIIDRDCDDDDDDLKLPFYNHQSALKNCSNEIEYWCMCSMCGMRSILSFAWIHTHCQFF